jgi:hypothetical protein
VGTIVDGGLGLELERRGFTYTTRLWSGEALLSRPDLLVAIHRDFLAAGARVIETATYQLAHATLRDLGYDDAAIDALFVRAVACARDAIATHVARDASATAPTSGRSPSGRLSSRVRWAHTGRRSATVPSTPARSTSRSGRCMPSTQSARDRWRSGRRMSSSSRRSRRARKRSSSLRSRVISGYRAAGFR